MFNSKTDTLIKILSLILAILILIICYIVYLIFNNPTLITNEIIPLAGTLANLILAIISLITMLLNRKYTLESLKQTNETITENKSYNEKTLIQTNTMIKDNRHYNKQTLKQTQNLLKQNNDNLYIQLRFANAEKSLYKLMNELQLTILIYCDLKELHSPELLTNPRGFLLMQYVNLVSDIDLLEYIPLTLRSEFQYKFLNRLHIPPNEESEEYILKINTYENYKKVFREHILRHHEFETLVNKFNENCISEHFQHTFKLYFSSCISEEEIKEHIVKTILEIANTDPKKFILDEMNLNINDPFYSNFLKK